MPCQVTSDVASGPQMITPLTSLFHQDVRMAFRESKESTQCHSWTDLPHLPRARVETFLPALTWASLDPSRQI